MKIISGKYKGRKIEGFDIDGTRPTMDRVKESLFAVIQNFLDGSVVLDLFSGSGNLGLEALSEGAKEAILVDKNKKACLTISKNIKLLNIEEKVLIINSDYNNFLRNTDYKFNIIFLDPPYKTDYIDKSIKLIEKNDLLDKDGIIICESNDLEKIVYSNSFEEIKNKKYGDKYIVILKKI